VVISDTDEQLSQSGINITQSISAFFSGTTYDYIYSSLLLSIGGISLAGGVSIMVRVSIYDYIYWQSSQASLHTIVPPLE